MKIYQYSVYYPNTLFDGVVSFYEEGGYFVAFIIFFSSILLPIIKLLGVTFMLIMVKYNKFTSIKVFATKYYIFIHKLSKYTMIDVFVVVLSSSFIQYDDLVRIEIGSAFIPFTLVVFFTILANNSLDTKLIWKNR
jgi:paraquat-inducible protein A